MEVVPGSGSRDDGCCALCDVRAAGSLVTLCGTRRVVAYLDSEVAALIEPGRPEVLVAPRLHLSCLSSSPEVAGVVLGVLRRAASHLQCTYGASGSTVEPSLGVPGAPGHISYLVVPTPGDQELGPLLGPAVEARRLRDALRDRSAPRWAPTAAAMSALPSDQV